MRVVPPAADVDATPTWVEISLSWGTTPLLVHHLREPSGYALPFGDAPRQEILIEREGAMFVLVPDEAHATLVVDSKVLFRRDALRASWLEAHEAHAGFRLFRIERGRRCRFETRGLVVQVEGVAGEVAPLHLRPRLTRADWAVLAISALLHVAAIAALFVTTPALP